MFPKMSVIELMSLGEFLLDFSSPFFSFLFLSCPSFFFFFYSSLSQVDGWLVKENDKAAPDRKELEGASGT